MQRQLKALAALGNTIPFPAARYGAGQVIRTFEHVPGPRTDQEEAEFVDRDQKWMARCHPVIKQDQYGVSRYHYTASGCEFGVISVDIMQH